MAATVKGFGCRPIVRFELALGAGIRKPPTRSSGSSRRHRTLTTAQVSGGRAGRGITELEARHDCFRSIAGAGGEAVAEIRTSDRATTTPNPWFL